MKYLIEIKNELDILGRNNCVLSILLYFESTLILFPYILVEIKICLPINSQNYNYVKNSSFRYLINLGFGNIFSTASDKTGEY